MHIQKYNEEEIEIIEEEGDNVNDYDHQEDVFNVTGEGREVAEKIVIDSKEEQKVVDLERRERNQKIVIAALMDEIPEEEYDRIVARVDNGEEIKHILKDIGIENEEISRSRARSSKRFPWEEMERLYTNGKKEYFSNGKVGLKYLTLREVAKIYGCSVSTIEEVSMKGQWGIKRDLLKKRRKQEMYKETYAVLSNEATMHDAKLLSRLQRIEELMENQLDLAEDTTNLEERIDPREIKSLLECLEKSHSIARKLYGEPVNLYDIEKEINNRKREKEDDKKIRTENAVSLLDTLLKRKERLERKKEKQIVVETVDVESEEVAMQ